MSAMVNLEIPWINIMSKMDLVTSNPDDESSGARIGLRKRKNYARYVNLLVHLSWVSLSLLPQSGWDIPKIAPLRFLDPDPLLLVNEPGREGNVTNPKFHSLNKAIVQLVSIILYLNWKEEWPRSYEIDWGPPPCLILTPGPHQSRFSWDCYQSHWLYYAIWRRWRTKGGVFFVFFWNGTAATMIVFMYTYTCTDVWLFVQPHDLDEGDFQDLEWCPGR